MDESLYQKLLNEISELKDKNTRLQQELIRNRQSLVLSENDYFKTLTETMSTAIVIYNEQGLLFVNNATKTITGYTENELLNGNFWMLIHPDHIPMVQSRRRALSNGIALPPEFELKLLSKDGAEIWVDFTVSDIVWKGLPAFMGTASDISKRKASEAELVKFKLCIQSSFAAIFITNTEGEIFFVNPAFEILYGIPAAEAIGKTPRIIKSGVYPVEVYQGFWSELLANHQVKGELINKTSDGRLITVEAFNTAIFDESHQTVGYVSIHRDITDKKLAEAQVLKLSQAVQQAPVSVIITNKQGDIEYANSKTMEVTGYQPEEIIGNNTRMFSSHEKTRDEYNLMWQTILNGNEWKGEFHNKKKDGTLYWELATLSPIKNNNGEIVNFVALKEDITERKLTEAELLRAKLKAEESDRLKSAFLANMSHEIRTPMNGILGFAELLKDTDLSGEEQQAYIDIIGKSGEKMLEIINDIIDISKIESGAVELKIAPFDVDEQMNFLFNFFKPEVETKGVILSCEIPHPNKPAIIVSDCEKVVAILTNLVKNAIKFTPSGSICFGYRNKDKTIEFFVKDSGIGVPANRRTAIFERFVQANQTDASANKGAGLGLSISKAYAEMLGGKIWVEPNAEQGSCFWVSLPC